MSAILLLMLMLPATMQAAACTGTVYLTFDTGNMAQADDIAATLNKHKVKATFFLANEKTLRGDFSLDDSWASYWKARAAEGHAFGSHTWDHRYFRREVGADKVSYVSKQGKTTLLDADQVCAELRKPDATFEKMTGYKFNAIWRAPGGRTTPRTLAFAARCGYTQHVDWAKAGFLGDELPSDTHPNDMLLEKALRDIRGGDILLMHLGVWSRKQALAPILDPLIAGLKSRGLCFATVPEMKSAGK
ncbi:MAG: polysaccharide deacetylase family protein [Burkholderiales bacterium]